MGNERENENEKFKHSSQVSGSDYWVGGGAMKSRMLVRHLNGKGK